MSEQVHTSVIGLQIPAHLRQYVVAQEYDKYTPINQAVWRYVLRQNSAFLAEKGHGSYIDGLRATGMSIEKIPNMDEMNARLANLGWGAVAVDGFIPPVAFFDFQAHGILPIASDIRTHEHVAYTPAPDIIHESAGHAPMLADRGYAEFVKKFGEIGAKALSSKEDLAVYEAIRLLSILKEDPHATEEEVAAAEASLDEKLSAVTYASEATQAARLYWWTVEYGLIGDLNDPKIYGAGLLSSMGESRSCLKADVVKLPFSLEACINTDYNITKPQPQLFVCHDFEELSVAIEEFADRMAFRVGGTASLFKALNSGNTATMVYSSGLQVTGTLTDLVLDAQEEAVYLKTTGASALAVDGSELPGHDKSYHAEGFGSPIGKLKGFDTPIEEMSDALLREAGIVEGQASSVEFASGVVVEGIVRKVLRQAGKVVLITLDDCTVTNETDVLFRSEWGAFDMAVGAEIVSVFAGAADREKFHAVSYPASAVLTHRVSYTEEERMLHDLYQTVR
ncbi:MAG: aromatic amino acid hydroxylase, partial [Tumebacillaceae bacterium]